MRTFQGCLMIELYAREEKLRVQIPTVKIFYNKFVRYNLKLSPRRYRILYLLKVYVMFIVTTSTENVHIRRFNSLIIIGITPRNRRILYDYHSLRKETLKVFLCKIFGVSFTNAKYQKCTLRGFTFATVTPTSKTVTFFLY